jgi:hypothetical protein
MLSPSFRLSSLLSKCDTEDIVVRDEDMITFITYHDQYTYRISLAQGAID